MWWFQFTHPGKGATCVSSSIRGCVSLFQFTHPGKGATVEEFTKAVREMFQFTHPGKGATEEEEACELLDEVSIHAPWEGCDTLPSYIRPYPLSVSIHAPWEGCDARRSAPFVADKVSIHAPWEGCDSHGLQSCL